MLSRIRSCLCSLRFFFAGFALLAGCGSGGSAQTQGARGAVYVLTNQASANSVLVYRRAADGALAFSGSFETGGTGAGTGNDPLGSQGALALGPGSHLLFAVNAGSNEVSMFAVKNSELVLLDKVASGGTRPVSVAVSKALVYVLNAGDVPNISGFTIERDRLVPLSGSQQQLAGGSSADPAEVGFNADATVLLVTEKGTQTIDTYTVDRQGFASGPMPHISNGIAPFGFSITKSDLAIVTETRSDAVSSYVVGSDGNLNLVSGSVPVNQKAPCWLVTTSDGRYAYTANAGSGTIGSFSVTSDGVVTLLNSTAASLAGPPIDLGINASGEFQYAREGGGTVSGFRVEDNGSLTPVGSVTGIPDGAQGIAVR